MTKYREILRLKSLNLSQQNIAHSCNVSKKTVSRDINEIRSFLSEYRDIIGNAEIVYDRKKQKYHMVYYDYSVQSHSSTCDE